MAENTLYLDWARDVLNTEAEGLHEIAAALDDNFVRAAEALLHCKGRVVIAGMGKSGHIGRKMAATMASTGTPAFFVHPAEAAHGDLGMIVDNDVVVAISNSGESDEIAAIIPALKRKNITLICITAPSDFDHGAPCRYPYYRSSFQRSLSARPCTDFQYDCRNGFGRVRWR